MRRLHRIEGYTRTPQPDPPVQKRSRRRWLLRSAFITPVLLASGALLWFFHTRVVALGIVQGEVLTFTAPGSVVVQKVHVEPGQECEKGQPLVRLAARNVEAEQRVLEVRLTQARLRLELAEQGAELEDLQLGRRLDDRDRLAAEMEAAEAVVAGAQARFEHAQRELAICAGLRSQGRSSARELDATETEAVAAQAELARARANLTGVRTRWKTQRELVPPGSNGTELRRTELALLEAGVREAEQQQRRLDYQSGTRTIVAPLSGRVDRVYVRSDSHREEGDPLLGIYDAGTLYVVAYVRPADRGRLQIGAEVRMFPLGTSQAIAGVVREIHKAWGRVPTSIRQEFGQSETAITMRIECDEANRALLAPNMVLKVVGRGR